MCVQTVRARVLGVTLCAGLLAMPAIASEPVTIAANAPDGSVTTQVAQGTVESSGFGVTGTTIAIGTVVAGGIVALAVNAANNDDDLVAPESTTATD